MLGWRKTTRSGRRKPSAGRPDSPRRGRGRFELLESRRMLDSGVVFNEIMYHPTGDGASLEWVELHNQLAIDVDVSRWSIRGGIDYEFPEGTFVPGGGYLVVAASPEDLAAAGGPADALGPFTGRLANEGERLELLNNSDRLMNTVEYGDAAPWPVAADGSGTSLAKLDPNTDSEPAENWASSVLVGGTPGIANFPDGSEPAETVTLLAIDATWAYDQSGSELGTAWREPAYDDGAWPTGSALLYVEEAYLPAPKNTPLVLGQITYYFRTEFDLPADSLTWLRLRHVIDDGAVFYLNGIEVYRLNLPEGGINSQTTADPYVTDATLSDYLTIPVGLLQPGANVLAVEVHQHATTSTDVVMGAELTAEVAPVEAPEIDEGLVFNEVAGAGTGTFWIELANAGDASIDPGGYVVRSSEGDEYVLPSGSIGPGELAAFTAAQLGFAPAEGDKLFLATPDGTAVIDAVVVADELRGRSPEFPGCWLSPDAPTPGTANLFTFHEDVVINEIMYHHRALWTPEYTESDEEWIELYNRGTLPVDLTGWTLQDAVGFAFAPGTTLGPGEYLVVANNADALRAEYPDIDVVGNFSGTLSDFGERIALVDARGNPADEVHYYDDGRWPGFADGGGSSLELSDPAADNAAAEAWAASDETGESGWYTYTYRGAAAASCAADAQWQEFILGLLDAGVVFLDDIHVVEDPDGTAIELLQNGTFESGATAWRLLGTHSHGEVIVDPDDPGNHFLRLVATGPTEHMHNHAETTLAGGRTIVNGRVYEITFRAKWVSGSPLLNTRLYFNRLAETTLLVQPSSSGTPGTQNTAYVVNVGPTYCEFQHSPVVPDAGQAVSVSAVAEDPDGVADMTLWYAVNGGTWVSLPMVAEEDGRFVATIPGQAASSVVQFYVAGVDAWGAQSTYPGGGRDSRALYKVEDGQAATNGLHNFRIIMTPADTALLHTATNVMSNDRLGATVIYNESQVFYDVGVRLKGSERGRNVSGRLGFNVRFQADQLFLGVHRTVSIDRSEEDSVGQREALIHEAINHAGDFVSVYSDLVKVIAPNPTHTSTAELVMAYYDDVLLESQFEDGDEGGLFEYELVYYPTTTDTGTPEGLKLPNPDSVAGIWIHDLGDDKEAYRWYLLDKKNLAADDYDRLIEFAQVFGLEGSEFHSQIDDYIDVDEWLRAFAFATLSGAGDNYASYAQHNAYFYIRPEDGRMLYFPHDMDRNFSATRSLYAAPDLQKLVSDPVKQRLYLSHVYDICTSTYNVAYMAHWANQFGGLLPGQNFASHLTFIGQRSDYALAQVTGTVPSVAFAVNDGGQVLLAEDGVVTLTGTGWVDVREVHLAGDPAALPVTWTGLNTWRLELPVSAGVTELALEALDFHGNPVGSDAVTVYSDTSGLLLRDFLRITELDYNPAQPSEAELAQGFTDNNDFEFIELTNTGPVPLDLDGAAFTDGIDYTFDGQGSPVTLAPGASVVVVRSVAAFEARYGTSVFVAGQYDGKLANDGESIVLRDAFGGIVEEFAYGDDPPWPAEADGDGASLHRRAADVSAGDPENWRAAPPTPGSFVVESSVVGRYVFYNNSRFDGRDPAAGASDDGAIAPDKTPLLPGGTATLANYTSYNRGINGIMIDVADLPDGITPQLTDFQFLVGNSNDPGTWTVATAPKSVSVRPGEGVDGSARITILWDDHAIENRWLRVQVLAERLWLPEDDVFYWGNAPGESGDSTAHALVNITDVLGVRDNLRGPLTPAAIDDPYDFNRDRLVNVTDILFARDHMTSPLGALRLIAPIEEAAEREALGHRVPNEAKDVANRQAVPFGPLMASGGGNVRTLLRPLSQKAR